MEVYDSKGRFVGLANVAQQLHDKLGHLTQAQRNAAMGQMFSNAALTTGNTLLEGGAKAVEKYTKMVNQQGFAGRVAATQMDNLKGQVTRLSNAWDAMLIKIGSGGKGVISSMVGAVTDLVNAFSSLPSGVQQAIIAITALTGLGAGLYDLYLKSKRYNGLIAKSFDFIGGKIKTLFTMLRTTKLGMGLELAFRNLSKTATEAFSNIWYRIVGTKTGISEFRASVLGLSAVATGVLAASLAVAAIGFASWQAKADAAKRQTDALKDTARDSGDVYRRLADELRKGNDGVSWFTKGTMSFTDALKNCGVSMDTFISAVRGGKTSIASFNKALNKTWQSAAADHIVARNSINVLKEGYEQAKKSIKDADAALKEEQAQRKANVIAASQHTDALMKGAEAAAKNSGEVLKVAKVEDILAAKFGASKDAINAQAQALNNNVEAIEKYYGFTMNAQHSITDLDKAIRDAGKAAAESGRHWMDNTEAADKNMDALSRLAKQCFTTAEAMASNGDSLNTITGLFEKGSSAFIDIASKMGLSKEQAEKLAKSWGLTRDSLKSLIDEVKSSNVESKITAKDDFSEVFKRQNLAVKELKGGKFQISGDNKQALEAIKQITKTKLDSKKMQIVVDKKQLQTVYAAVKKMKLPDIKARVKPDLKQVQAGLNGVKKIKIPDKTVVIKGDKHNFDTMIAGAKAVKIPDKTVVIKGNPRFAKKAISDVNTSKIPDKTVVIKGNKNAFQQKYNEVQSARVSNKTVHFYADTSSVWSAINAINRASVNINARVHRAHGGVVYGAGTGTSDSIPAMLSNGEYVMTAAAVHRLGVSMLDRLNYSGAQSMQSMSSSSGDVMLVKTVEGLRSDIRVLNEHISNSGDSQTVANAIRGVFNDGIKLKLDANGRETMAGMLASPISRELNRLSELGR